MFDVHGFYETSCVEKLNDMTSSFRDIRGSDPVTALWMVVEFCEVQFMKREKLAHAGSGVVTPRMKKILRDFSVTISSSNPKRATIVDPRLVDEDAFVLSYETEIFPTRSRTNGLAVKCSCNRNAHGQLCEHTAAHISKLLGTQLED